MLHDDTTGRLAAPHLAPGVLVAVRRVVLELPGRDGDLLGKLVDPSSVTLVDLGFHTWVQVQLLGSVMSQDRPKPERRLHNDAHRRLDDF